MVFELYERKGFEIGRQMQTIKYLSAELTLCRGGC